MNNGIKYQFTTHTAAMIKTLLKEVKLLTCLDISGKNLSQKQHTHTHTHTLTTFYNLPGFCLGLPKWAGIRKVKPGR